MRLKLIERSTQLPISLDLAKGYLRIHHAQEDTLLAHLIETAVKWVEEASGKTLTPKTWLLTDSKGNVLLPNPPVLKILEVKLKGVVLNEQQYALVDHNGRFHLEIPSAGTGTVSVKYTTGYGEDPKDIPETLKNTVLTTLAYLYENRGEKKISPSNGHVAPWIQYHRDYHLI